MKDTSSVRVRIAPSPTGYPHIGTIYQGLFNYAFAHRNEGKFVIRIEDTDRERFVSDAEEKIYAAFDWFGLVEDESSRKGGPFSPYRQSERLDLYQKYTQQLIEQGHAYYCFCTKERLEEVRAHMMAEKKQPMYDKHCRNLSQEEVEAKLAETTTKVVRMKIPEDEKITFRDEIRGEITYDSATVDDQVILKSDGFPTYHLAVVVDDHEMQISHIVRGEEWLPSTPKHILLYKYFGWDAPKIYHTSALRNPDKSKLSKRQGHTNVSWYQDEGYLPAAILNYIALLGWSHPEEKEIFSLDEFVNNFDLKDMSAVGPIFDLTKLTWMNQHYIMQLPIDELKVVLEQFYKDDIEVKNVLSHSQHPVLISLSQTRMKTLKDFKDLVVPMNNADVSNSDKEVANALVVMFQQIEEWKKDTLLEKLKLFIKEKNCNWQLLYVLLTGRPHGLPLADIIELSGKEEMLKRLHTILS